jgi:ABC-type nitrate/sulfonate/bicarbonate transport system substrate-binding protein
MLINMSTENEDAVARAYSSISGAGIVAWLAVDKGLFAKYDLDVELIYVAGSQAMQSLQAERRRGARLCQGGRGRYGTI